MPSYRQNKKRKRQVQSAAFKQAVKEAVYDVIYPPKTWVLEADELITSAALTSSWWIPLSHCSTTDISAAWVDKGHNGSLLGGADSGERNSMVHSAYTEASFRNLTDQPVEFSIYWCRVMEPTLDSDGVRKGALQELREGLEAIMFTDDETTDQLGAIDTVTNSMSSTLKCYTPYHSQSFMAHYRVFKKDGGLLAPGQVYKATFTSRSRMFNRQVLRQAKSDSIGNYTEFPLVKFHGVMGVNSASDFSAPQRETGFMSATIGCGIYKRITMKFAQPHAPLLAVTNNKVTTLTGTNADLQGPSRWVTDTDGV